MKSTVSGRPGVSMIVSTYNRPAALDLCLQSIARQTILPDEVVIGDDGSTEETRKLIQSFQEKFPVPIIHVWQEDEGFRLAMCRNKSVAACSKDYIIEIDGDLILEKRFIEDHLRFARKGFFLKGGRVNLTQKYTDHLCDTCRLPDINFFTPGVRRRSNTIHSSLLSNYFAPRYKKDKVVGLGCNMSFWKEDFILINGYDEFYEGWGGEDYDLALRLGNGGINRLYLKFSGIAYHLWHRDKFMYNKSKNFQYYNEKKKIQVVRCEKGIDQYLERNPAKTR